jgi:hypothetical protein
MKKSMIILFTIILVSLNIQAQENNVNSNDSIIFDMTTYDYGTIPQGGDGNSEFTFTNKGDAPLILYNVHASCGCTVPQWPKEPIAPGKTGVIKVKYNTNSPGPFSKSITVNSNAANSSVSLRIKGNVTASQVGSK